MNVHSKKLKASIWLIFINTSNHSHSTIKIVVSCSPRSNNSLENLLLRHSLTEFKHVSVYLLCHFIMMRPAFIALTVDQTPIKANYLTLTLIWKATSNYYSTASTTSITSQNTDSNTY